MVNTVTFSPFQTIKMQLRIKKGQDYFDDIKTGAFVFATYKLKTLEF